MNTEEPQKAPLSDLKDEERQTLDRLVRLCSPLHRLPKREQWIPLSLFTRTGNQNTGGIEKETL